MSKRGRAAWRTSCALPLLFGFLACNPPSMAPSLVADVQPLRDSGYALIDSAVGHLQNDAESSRDVTLDSGRTYVLLARCECDGMSVKVAPHSLLRQILPHHWIPDALDEVYSEPAVRLRFVASRNGRHLIRLRMSECTQWTFLDGEWAHRAGTCGYGLYLLQESSPAERAPPGP